MAEIHIPTLAPEALFHLGPVTVTNTMVNAWLAIVIFAIIGIVITRTAKLRPGKFQNGFEHIIEILFGYFFIPFSVRIMLVSVAIQQYVPIKINNFFLIINNLYIIFLIIFYLSS